MASEKRILFHVGDPEWGTIIRRDTQESRHFDEVASCDSIQAATTKLKSLSKQNLAQNISFCNR